MKIKERMVRQMLGDMKTPSAVLANDLSLTHNICGNTETIFNRMFSMLNLKVPVKDYKKKIKRSKYQKRNKITPFSLRDKRWFVLRQKVFDIYGQTCMSCGSTDQIEVDHIKPKSLYPKLAYSLNNLQILCHKCNKKKSNRNCDDYREKYEQEQYELSLISENRNRGF